VGSGEELHTSVGQSERGSEGNYLRDLIDHADRTDSGRAKENRDALGTKQVEK
jgi:hypothetical protein